MTIKKCFTLDADTTSVDLEDTHGSHNIWLRIVGMKNHQLITDIGAQFNLHELTIEDIKNLTHQQKFEDMEEQEYKLYIIKTFYTGTNYYTEDNYLTTNQLCIVAGKDFIITFEEDDNAFITAIQEKINVKKKPIAKDRLVYTIIDKVVDNYLDRANNLQEMLDNFEDTLITNDSDYDYDLNSMFNIKREIHLYKRTVKPMEDIVYNSRKVNGETKESTYYIRDLVDHVNRANGVADSMWDSISIMHTEVLTLLQFKQGKMMTLMNAAATIFLPLMFITGLYGMNFENMPELVYDYAYPIVLAVMGLFTIISYVYMKKNKIL